MRDLLRAGALLCAGAFSASCATISHGTHENVSIDSRPQNAEVLVDGVPHGRTPAVIRMDSTQPHTVTLRAPNHADAVLRTECHLDTGYIVMDVLLGLVPLLVDLGSKAWYTVQPSPINVVLQPSSSVPAPATTASSPAAGAVR